MGIKGLHKKPIGLAIVGCGRVGRIRGRCAAEYPGVEWIGCCDVDEGRAKELAEELGADFYCTDYKELLARSEVNAAVLATDENEHAGTLWAAIEAGHSILVEKPLATNAVESARIVEAAEKVGVDLLVGYTQRFRRRWLTAREQVASGMLGDITSATTRAFLNRMVGITRLEAWTLFSGCWARGKNPSRFTPAQLIKPWPAWGPRIRPSAYLPLMTGPSGACPAAGRCLRSGRLRLTALRSESSVPRECSPLTTPTGIW
jgi:hypothetical protein